MRYNVKWIDFWKSLTKQMSLMIIYMFIGITLFHFVSTGFSIHETFKNVTFWGSTCLILGLCVSAAILMFLIAYPLKFAFITIEDGIISGKNFWGKRISLPLKNLKSIEPYNNQGINAMVLNDGAKGKVYIYFETEKLDEILKIIDSYLPKDQQNI